jgi:hypothetical protein
MLELDYAQRTESMLDSRLRARLRWVVARANRCAYGEACADEDWRKAGGDPGKAGHDLDRLPAEEQSAVEFARKLTEAAHHVSDTEVARLLSHYGDRRVVAMALLVAYANFLDRLALTLKLPPDAGPHAAVEVRFDLAAPPSRAAPPRSTVDRKPVAPAPFPALDPQWAALDPARLRQEMARQRGRRPRLPLPENQAGAIQWGLLCRTYQPRLAGAWTACKQAFEAEADQDRVFEASLFWVVTRTEQSFY